MTVKCFMSSETMIQCLAKKQDKNASFESKTRNIVTASGHFTYIRYAAGFAGDVSQLSWTIFTEKLHAI